MLPGQYTVEATAALEHEVLRRGVTPARVQEILDDFRRQRLESAAEGAGQLAQAGYSRSLIEGYLRQAGMDPTDAMFTAAAAARMPDDERKRAAVRNMVGGAALCAAALVVAAVGWYLSVQERGLPMLGFFWWIWLIPAGVAQFVRGLKQFGGEKRE
jgi:hypothetical protein